MTPAIIDKEARNRAKAQATIMASYKERVELNQTQLCSACKWANTKGKCNHGLLPVCLNGSDCIYFEEKSVGN
jgi:hypothetical protein